jgi:hypothetical protein
MSGHLAAWPFSVTPGAGSIVEFDEFRAGLPKGVRPWYTAGGRQGNPLGRLLTAAVERLIIRHGREDCER